MRRWTGLWIAVGLVAIYAVLTGCGASRWSGAMAGLVASPHQVLAGVSWVMLRVVVVVVVPPVLIVAGLESVWGWAYRWRCAPPRSRPVACNRSFPPDSNR